MNKGSPRRDVFLKIERMPGYSPLAPLVGSRSYGRDAMYNAGHEIGRVQPSEIAAATLDALVYREYLDPHFSIPNTAKLVASDINEPPWDRRVPGAVLYAEPGERLYIHVLNADPDDCHSLHVHGVKYGVDSDGAWPFGVRTRHGRRSDEILPGEMWTYVFDVTESTIGAWAFHDHAHMVQMNVNRGLFGALIVRDPSAPAAEDVPMFVHALQAPASTDSFQSQQLKKATPKEKFEHEFSAVGTVGYHCKIHGVSMSGTVVVDPFAPAGDRAVDIIDNAFTPASVSVRPGNKVVWTLAGNFDHIVLAPGGGAVTYCLNGRAYVGNTPTIEADSGRRLRWHVLNLDLSSVWHNYHPHSARWQLPAPPGGAADVHGLSPAEGFTAETLVPQALRLPCALEELQCDPPPDACRVRVKGDFLFHCHLEEHMMAGLAGLVRARDWVWVTRDALCETTLDLPLHDVRNRLDWVDQLRCGGCTSDEHDPHDHIKSHNPCCGHEHHHDQGHDHEHDHEHGGDADRCCDHDHAHATGKGKGGCCGHDHGPRRCCGHDEHEPCGECSHHPQAGHTHTQHTQPARPEAAGHDHPPGGMGMGMPSSTSPGVTPLDVCDLSQKGYWELLPVDSQVLAVHAALMHTGEVLFFAGSGNNVPNFNARLVRSTVWNYEQGTFHDPDCPFDVFCAHQTVLGDGKVLVAGGTDAYDPFVGSAATYLFDPTLREWIRVADMAAQRWYPTLVTLGDGHALVSSGRETPNEEFDPTLGWKTLPKTTFLPLYPHLFLLADGTLFYTGGQLGNATIDPRVIHPATGAEQTVPGLRVKDHRDQCSSVLLPPAQDQRLMVIGGSGAGQATNKTDLVDLSSGAAAASFTPGPDLARARGLCNSVILPDRTVLITGGGLHGETRSDAVHLAEIYDPTANTIQSVAEASVSRLYHSVALLLPDGRVATAGSNPDRGDDELRLELYHPPYLFRGTRPLIESAPTEVEYGDTMEIRTPSAASIRWAHLIRPMAVTHSDDTSQRLIDLPITCRDTCSLTVDVTDNPDLAPPGWYMLFLVDDCGVPSEAVWVRVRSPRPAPHERHLAGHVHGHDHEHRPLFPIPGQPPPPRPTKKAPTKKAATRKATAKKATATKPATDDG
jgi:FtsP/CotA-like multicopper oxidase with cupredoxin domain